MNEDNNGAGSDTSAQDEAAALEAAKAAEAAAAEAGEETIEDVRERLAQAEADKAQALADKAKADELAQNQKIRAEKAERDAKGGKDKPEGKELSTKEVYVLMEAKVPQEDVDEVVEYARFKKISVADALKTSVIKTSLAEKAEQRKTADAANVDQVRRGSGKVPDDVLLAKASKGELPDNDADMERLTRLRKGIK